MELSGAVCLVTGAASGIGAALVGELERAGARLVAAVDVAGEGSPPAAPTGRLGITADVSRVGDLRRAFRLVTDTAGRLDVVFNNAGILGDPWPQQSPESVVQLAAVNLRGVMAGTRLALDAMPSGGVVVNTASKTGLFEHGDAAAYAATKAGIIHFTRCCAGLATTHHVRVNAVLPGMTATGLLASPSEPMGLLDPRDVAGVLLDVARDDTCEPGSYRLADRDTIAAERDVGRSTR